MTFDATALTDPSVVVIVPARAGAATPTPPPTRVRAARAATVRLVLSVLVIERTFRFGGGDF